MKLDDVEDKKIGNHGRSPSKLNAAPDIAPWGANIPGAIPDDITQTGRDHDLNNTGALTSHHLNKDDKIDTTNKKGQNTTKK